MKIVYDNLDFLKNISRTRSISKRNEILKNANTYEILAILEISINILKSRIKLKPAQKRKLATYADYLRELSRKKTEKSTREYLQKGEGAILPALIIPIVAQAIASLLTRKND